MISSLQLIFQLKCRQFDTWKENVGMERAFQIGFSFMVKRKVCKVFITLCMRCCIFFIFAFKLCYVLFIHPIIQTQTQRFTNAVTRKHRDAQTLHTTQVSIHYTYIHLKPCQLRRFLSIFSSRINDWHINMFLAFVLVPLYFKHSSPISLFFILFVRSPSCVSNYASSFNI